MDQSVRKALPWVLAGLTWIAAQCAHAQDLTTREYQIKAAFIYNFVQFVTWPDDAFADEDSPIIIVVFGDEDPFAGALHRIVRDKQVDGRAIHVHFVPTVDRIEPAHVVFIPVAYRNRAATILARLSNAPVLTIAEHHDFLHDGGIIRFFLEANKIRFEINVESAKEARLHISSRLLQLARIFRRPAKD